MKTDQKEFLRAFAERGEDGKKEAGHNFRVYQITRLVAEGLKKKSEYKKVLSGDEAECIAYASMLHDAGKMYVPDEILLKKGKLTAAEHELVKSHIEIGEKMRGHLAKALKDEKLLSTVLDIMRHHHDNFDGSGYTDVRGAEIPVSARIAALADVYDSLRSERPYKRPYSHDEAVVVIKALSGKKFFPEVVEAFLKTEARIKALYLK